MKKIFEKVSPGLLAALVVAVLTVYATGSFMLLPRPRGLIIHAPQSEAGRLENQGNVSANNLAFSQIDPVVFAAAFGLEYERKKPEPVEKPEIVEEKPLPAIEEPVEKPDKFLDLAAAGYRLKGIVLEKDGNSAAFIYEPKSKKTLVVREKSKEALRLISATMRSIKLQTPEGEGILQLEEPAGSKGRSGTGNSSGIFKTSAQTNSARKALSEKAIKKTFENEKLLSQPETSSNSIVKNISAGNFLVKPDRGVYQVEVRSVPAAFLGYGLRPGDKILGTSDGDFRQSGDIPNKLGQLSEQPKPLKIQRGGRAMFLNPPKVKQSPENASGQKPPNTPPQKPLPGKN